MVVMYILHRYIVLNSVIRKKQTKKKGNKAKFYLSETKISYSVLPKLADLSVFEEWDLLSHLRGHELAFLG